MELALLVLLMALVIHFPRKSGPARVQRGNSLTPRIEVTFNDEHKEEMILDTGASVTTITQNMAKTLKVKPVGEAVFTLADNKQVKMPIGKVESIEVGGAKVENVVVAIGNVPLLGQSFFGNHEVIIKRDVVEFRE
ncbi:MAG: retroviral-like aspartic protease family protein [Brasilonema octagenarum HA4186-MV1]|jgi:aspartyl protease family protein|nr:retroviral-like aspartic protease family protein [Brasilonema octagenarum HA4186-MV1]